MADPVSLFLLPSSPSRGEGEEGKRQKRKGREAFGGGVSPSFFPHRQTTPRHASHPRKREEEEEPLAMCLRIRASCVYGGVARPISLFWTLLTPPLGLPPFSFGDRVTRR